jgi:hypothetical protein
MPGSIPPDPAPRRRLRFPKATMTDGRNPEENEVVLVAADERVAFGFRIRLDRGSHLARLRPQVIAPGRFVQPKAGQ